MKKIIKTILWKIWDFYVKYFTYFVFPILLLSYYSLFIVAIGRRDVMAVLYVVLFNLWASFINKKELGIEIRYLGFLLLSCTYFWYNWDSMSSGEWKICREIFCF